MKELKDILNAIRDERILNNDCDDYQNGVIYGLTIALKHIKEMEEK